MMIILKAIIMEVHWMETASQPADCRMGKQQKTEKIAIFGSFKTSNDFSILNLFFH